jgi:hypothetical protein
LPGRDVVMKTGVENGREATVAAEFMVNGRKGKSRNPKV